MRKILTQKFWSHGTPLGYLGPVSQKALTQRACRFQIHLIWDPYEVPALVALQIHAKKPKLIAAWCVPNCYQGFWSKIIVSGTIIKI